MKDVIINIHSIHDYQSEDESTTDFTTDGFYFFDNGVGCLSYMESEVTGLEGTRTSVMVRPDEVVVDRDGLLKSRMVFREGMKDSFLYNTPYGTATLGLDTRKIRHCFDDNGGSMEIDYIINMEHAVVTRNRFELNVVEQKGDSING